MTYTPGDAVGIVPTNREAQVDEVLQALGFTGTERVLDHYKVEISLHEALTTRLGIGKLARGSVNQYAKLVRRTKHSPRSMCGGESSSTSPKSSQPW